MGSQTHRSERACVRVMGEGWRVKKYTLLLVLHHATYSPHSRAALVHKPGPQAWRQALGAPRGSAARARSLGAKAHVDAALLKHLPCVGLHLPEKR